MAIFPDGPWRYWNTVFDDDHCMANHLLEAAPAEHPDEICHPAEREVTRWTRCTAVIDPIGATA